MLVLPLFCMLQPFPWFGLDVRHQGATDGEVNQFPIAHPSSSHRTSLQFPSHIPPSPITHVSIPSSGLLYFCVRICIGHFLD